MVLDLIFGLLRLSAVCRSDTARLRLVPAVDMLEVTFGDLIASETRLRAASIFDSDAQLGEQEIMSVLGSLVQVVEQALTSDRSVQVYLERASSAIRELVTIGIMVQSEHLNDIHLRFSNALVFRYMHSLHFGSISGWPITVLIGATPKGDALLAIPEGTGTVLDQIQLAYAVTDMYPRLTTDYWVRVLPDPNKQRMQGSIALEVFGNKKIELYRRRIPGEGPLMLIASEALTFPLDISVTGLSMRIDADTSVLKGIRTIVRDKHQTQLLIAARFIAAD